MRKLRVSILLIICQAVLLLVAIVFICVTTWHNWFLTQMAKDYAAQAGFAEAQFFFARGNYWIYEIKLYKFDANDSGTVPTDGTTEPAGRMDGKFQIYYFLVDQSWPKVHQEIQQAFVDAHNKRMRLFFDHPDWFDKNGLRIAIPSQKLNTNSLGSGK